MVGEKRAGRHSVMLDGQKDKLSLWVCARRWRQSFMTKQCACNSTRTNEPHKQTHRQIHAHTDTRTNTCTPAHTHTHPHTRAVSESRSAKSGAQKQTPTRTRPFAALWSRLKSLHTNFENLCLVQWNLAEEVVYSVLVWTEWIDHSFKLEIG